MRFATGFDAAKKLLERRANSYAGNSVVEQSVRAVIEEIVRDGDAALRRFTAKYDRVDLKTFEVPRERIAAAKSAVEPELLSRVGNGRRPHPRLSPGTTPGHLRHGNGDERPADIPAFGTGRRLCPGRQGLLSFDGADDGHSGQSCRSALRSF